MRALRLMSALTCGPLLLLGCMGGVDRGPARGRGACEDLRPGGSALRRLTPTEYRNSVADLFPGASLPTVNLTPDLPVGGFDNNAEGQPVSDLLTEDYFNAGHDIGAAASTSLATWAPCSENTAECAGRIVDHLLLHAQRRPPTEEDRSAYLTMVEATRAESGIEDAVAAMIEAVLLTPQFLYRPEVGTPRDDAAPGLLALTDYEVASRLSYFLWRSTPDDTLLDAAAAGALSDPLQVEEHARRMLEDPRAHDTIADLHAQWFQIGRLDSLRLDTGVFPDADGQLVADMHASLVRYLDAVFWEDGTLDALFAGRFAFVNDRLAPIFGVPAPGTDELVRVELDPEERAGILTQPGWLAHRAHETVHSPIFRGTFVLEHVLCAPTPPAPPGAESETVPLPPGTIVTTRERTVRSHSGACASCHSRIDGVGFVFENYDALGRFRTVETSLSLPIDPSGVVRGAGDMDGPVIGAVELGERLATSRDAGRCVAEHYLRYAIGRSLTDTDRCAANALRSALSASGGDLHELVVALVTSNTFRFRTAH